MNSSFTVAALLSALAKASIDEIEFYAKFNGQFTNPETVILTNEQVSESGFVLQAESGKKYTF